MISFERLESWLEGAPETENLEFKEAKQQYDSTKLLRYVVALANERGGYLVLVSATSLHVEWWVLQLSKTRDRSSLKFSKHYTSVLMFMKYTTPMGGL